MNTNYKFAVAAPFAPCYDLDAFFPEHWAMESVAILEENMVAANLVHRDFEMEFAQYGDVVNTRQPAEFAARRKGIRDDVTTQDADATNIAVPLDQHVHVSFVIYDGEETRSFKDLVAEYLRPASLAMARMTDQIVLGQWPRFLENQAGTIGGLTDENAVEYITAMRQVMNVNKVPMTGRNQIWTPSAETLVIQNPTFHQADRVGDEGTALREASLGRKFGFDHYMAQNMASLVSYGTTGSGAINNGNITKGSTVLTVDDFGASEVVPGNWITINGKVYHVIATDNATATELTLSYGLVEDVANDDAITVYPDTTINLVAGYAAGYSKFITLTSTADAQVGGVVSFTTSDVRYTIIEVSGNDILLDRPLAAGLSNGDLVNFGPSGDFNMAFHRNAMSLVVRPLKPPKSGTGAIAAVQSYNGVTVRVVITYDGQAQGHRVTLDYLAGIQVLDRDLGGVLLT